MGPTRDGGACILGYFPFWLWNKKIKKIKKIRKLLSLSNDNNRFQPILRDIISYKKSSMIFSGTVDNVHGVECDTLQDCTTNFARK